MNIPDIIKDTLDLLTGEMQRVHEEYRALHEELNKHRGKPLGETDLVEANRILKEIQLKFQELFPILHFIGLNHTYATNMTNQYNEFINQIRTDVEESTKVANG